MTTPVRRRSSFVLAVAAGAGLSLTVWTHVLAWRAEENSPPSRSSLEVEGLRLCYVEKGAGRPVILLHGAYGSIEDWSATILDAIALRCRAIAFDRPGHGHSDGYGSTPCSPAEQARLVHAALVELGVRRPILVGFSFSGAIAASYALQYPDDTAGVMTVNGVLYEWEDISSVSDALLGLPIAGTVFAHTAAMPLGLAFARSSVENAFDPAPVSPRFALSRVELELRPASLLANAAEMRTLKPALRLQSTRYREIRVPLAIVTGLGDRITFARFHSFRIHDEVPGSLLFPVAGAGHQILYSHPSAVLSAFDVLLAEVDRREPVLSPR